MDKKSSILDEIRYSLEQMTTFQKVVWFSRMIFPTFVIIALCLAMFDSNPNGYSNYYDLAFILLAASFVMYGIQFFKERRIFSYLYFFAAVLILTAMFIRFFI